MPAPPMLFKVEYSGGYTPFNIARFGQHFNDKVANPNDILLFYKRRGFCDPQGGHKYLLDEIFYTKNK
jgi:double-strand break repair protein MRE11